MSALLPTYARSELSFARGEGAFLYTASGERYLDFASGVAVTALGHAHPHLVAALTEQAKKLWHVSNLHRIPEQERLADAALRGELRRPGVLRQFRRRGRRMLDQGRAALSFQERCARALPACHLRGRLSRQHARRPSPPAARPSISKASALRSTASTRSRRSISARSRGRSATRRREFSSSRSWAKAACARSPGASFRICARSPTRRASCCCSMRCRPAWAVPGKSVRP